MNIQVTQINETKAKAPRPRKANECFISPKRFFYPDRLFSWFWTEGEMALLFGPPGAGKSLLAVQVADALARGSKLGRFSMPTGRRKVLYVDLQRSDAQFQECYSYFPHKSKYTKGYKFAENLYRDRPAVGEDLCGWVRETVRENGFQVVIIDDLSAIKRTHDGTRETLPFMRQLRQLRDELHISILVLTDCGSSGRSGIVSEADLGRSRILCGVADSVFAIWQHPRNADKRRLNQTRSRSSGVIWNEKNAPVCRITWTETKLRGFVFDESYPPGIDEETRQLICAVRSMREAGATYRVIAESLSISKTRASTLYKKWTPAMEPPSPNDTDENDECDDDGEYDDEDDPAESDKDDSEETSGMATAGAMPYISSTPREMDVYAIPFAAALKRRSVFDLKYGIDDYGREIFIESEDEHTHRPKAWYRFDKKGIKIRYERSSLCTRVTRLNGGPYL